MLMRSAVGYGMDFSARKPRQRLEGFGVILEYPYASKNFSERGVGVVGGFVKCSFGLRSFSRVWHSFPMPRGLENVADSGFWVRWGMVL